MKQNIFLYHFLALFLVLCQGGLADADISLFQVRDDFVCPPVDGFYPSGPDCNQLYYICIGGVLYEGECPGSNVFDPNTLACVVPEDCSEKLTSTMQPTLEPFTCPTSEGFFPIPGTCGNDYYVCIRGVPYIETCPANGIFDPDLGLCVPPELASCFSCPSSEGTFPIPGGYCGPEYYICVGSVPYKQSCPGNGIFDPIILLCTPPESVSCEPTKRNDSK